MIKIKGRVIPDLIAAPEPENQVRHKQETDKRVIVGMGRLVPQKGFDLLLDAFARIFQRHPQWSVEIIGGGPLKQELEKRAEDLKISGKVHFAGEISNPFPALSQADLFVFSSRFEGFGLALCEAMACGLPVVSFDCASGPGDIVRHGVDGILVPPQDVEALATAMDRLMSDVAERERLASRAPEVLVRFSRDRILTLWQQLFDDLTFAPGRRVPMSPVDQADSPIRNDSR